MSFKPFQAMRKKRDSAEIRRGRGFEKAFLSLMKKETLEKERKILGFAYYLKISVGIRITRPRHGFLCFHRISKIMIIVPDMFVITGNKPDIKIERIVQRYEQETYNLSTDRGLNLHEKPELFRSYVTDEGSLARIIVTNSYRPLPLPEGFEYLFLMNEYELGLAILPPLSDHDRKIIYPVMDNAGYVLKVACSAGCMNRHVVGFADEDQKYFLLAMPPGPCLIGQYQIHDIEEEVLTELITIDEVIDFGSYLNGRPFRDMPYKPEAYPDFNIDETMIVTEPLKRHGKAAPPDRKY